MLTYKHLISIRQQRSCIMLMLHNNACFFIQVVTRRTLTEVILLDQMHVQETHEIKPLIIQSSVHFHDFLIFMIIVL